MKPKWLILIAVVSLAVGAKGEAPKMLEKGLKACGPDIERFCKEAAPGEGRVGECLYSHFKDLSEPCLKFARHGGRGHERESLREIDRPGPAAKADAPAVLIDVRTPEEYAAGHLDGAVNIPYDRIGERIKEASADPSIPILVYCKSGRRAGIARETLMGLGYTRVENGGGYEELKRKMSP